MATMSSLTPRTAWVDPKRPVSGPASNLSKVDEIVIHYPGVKPGALNLDDPAGVLRNTHVYYLGKGYSIGYNFATFPSGRFELRGFGIVNAANLANDDGTNDNPHTLSINVMVNGDDEATPSQVQYTRDMIADIWAHLGREVPIIGHGSVPGANTACPGAGIRRQLAAGLFLPQQQKPDPIRPPMPPASHQEDDMLPIITNAEPGLGDVGKVKFALMPDGTLRHLEYDEWVVRGRIEGTPWTNAQLSAAGTYKAA